MTTDIGSPEDFEGFRHETVSDARAKLKELMKLVAAGERVILTHYGERVAVLAPIGFHLDANDLDAADRAAIAASTDEPSIPFERTRTEPARRASFAHRTSSHAYAPAAHAAPRPMTMSNKPAKKKPAGKRAR